MSYNGLTADSPITIANMFATHFESVNTNDDSRATSVNSTCNRINRRVVDKEKVLKATNALKPKKLFHVNGNVANIINIFKSGSATKN